MTVSPEQLLNNRTNDIIKLPTRFVRERSFPLFRHGVFLTHWFVFELGFIFLFLFFVSSCYENNLSFVLLF
jgi:hypothetical protein